MSKKWGPPHTFRAGFDVEQIRFTQVYQGARGIGNPTFTRFADFLIGRASCLAFTGAGTCSPTNPGNTNGNLSASNISSVGNFTSVNSGDSHYLFHAWDLSGFVQDDIKHSPRLTVNVGLRWEYDGLTSRQAWQAGLPQPARPPTSLPALAQPPRAPLPAYWYPPTMRLSSPRA